MEIFTIYVVVNLQSQRHIPTLPAQLTISLSATDFTEGPKSASSSSAICARDAADAFLLPHFQSSAGRESGDSTSRS